MGLAAAIAAVYLAAHLLSLAPSLEDIDSINFALGLREFNPAEHQPHPPGYPVYIAAGRASLAAIRIARPALEQTTAEALALSIWSALSGALAIVCAMRVFRHLAHATSLDATNAARLSAWSTVFLAVCPLFWMTGVRPMSDMPGLAAALGAQALLLGGHLPAGAFLAAFAVGIRSQTLWLTLPLLVFQSVASGFPPPRANARYGEARRGDPPKRIGQSALTSRVAERPDLGEGGSRKDGWRAVAVALLMYAAGALVWAIPLVVASGGLQAYLAALSSQAGADFAFVDMLWANPTPRRLAFNLWRTLVLPWASVPLAASILALAVSGGLVLLVRDRRALLTLVVAFAPYAGFHLVFQETITVRYALPVMPLLVFPAVRSLVVTGRAATFIALPIAVGAFVIASTGVLAYGRDPHPAFRAVADMHRRAETQPPARITSHFELRRPLRAADLSGLPVTFAPQHREWLQLVEYWSGGGRDPIWFLANPRRTDLDLVDPHARRNVVRYRWAVEHRPELSGTRPIAADWYRLPPPGWFAGEGWSLTPETGGLARATAKGPDQQPIVAHVRRNGAPMHLVIGGRHLGDASDGPAVFELAVDGAVADRWALTFDERNFLRFLDLPQGIPGHATEYARLTVVSRPAEAGTSRRVPVGVRQFDIQPTTTTIYGFGQGWHEDEYEVETGRRWRWASERSVLKVKGPVQTLRVFIRGESPLRYFDGSPEVKLMAGGREVGRLQPAADFEWTVTVPADAVASSGGDLTLETSRVFIPAETEGSADQRHLGLRIFELRIEPARGLRP